MGFTSFNPSYELRSTYPTSYDAMIGRAHGRRRRMSRAAAGPIRTLPRYTPANDDRSIPWR